ncbi:MULTISPECIES: hypothetical protein [unclassified Bradyrhizobium]|uniref:hypothetical protein n=1 Tax=unclassified Bradyrhizobium TaxID=2631580 RepID=UPI0028E329F1|nr:MULTISPECIES: hypothetical protein [unclassified Bradyrhizobium]
MKVLYALALAIALGSGAAAASNNEVQADLGYPTVASALESLCAKPGTRSSMQSGWTVIEDKAALSVWSFAPSGHPAYPTAIRRHVVQDGDHLFIKMDVLCEAAKPACDTVVAEFERLNGIVRDDLKR